jgi:hypothetical protein
MKTSIKISLILFGMFVAHNLTAQISISLSPTNLSPSSYTITVTAAGTNPANPIVNYTNQSIKYKWPFLDQNLVGAVYVKSSNIPSGFTMTNLVTGSSGVWGKDGTSTGTVAITSNYQALITGIWSSNITRGMTQNLSISNFADLHPGSYTVTINYAFY